MGNKTSSHVQHTPLAPQLRFPRVVNARFALDRTSTLRLPFGFWAHRDDQTPLEIVDEETGAVAFKVRAPRASKDGDAAPATPLLLDKNGVPVVAMDVFPVGTDYAMYVPHVPMPARVARAASTSDSAPVWQESRALCYLQTNTRPLEKRLLVELEDPVTRGPLNIRVEGLWQNHEALFWLDRGLKRERDCIARVYVDQQVAQHLKVKQKQKKKNDSQDDNGADPTALYYCLGIAPGVDIAMVVLACAAMDEELAKKESGAVVEIPEDEITRMLAQRHHGTGDRNKWRSSTLVTAT